MNTDQLSWAPLPSRAISHGILPSRSLRRPKSALLKSRVASLLRTRLAALRIVNPTVLWSLQPRLRLTFTFPTSPSLLVRTRSSIAPLLVGSSVTWQRKLSSTHSWIPATSWIACVDYNIIHIHTHICIYTYLYIYIYVHRYI